MEKTEYLQFKKIVAIVESQMGTACGERISARRWGGGIAIALDVKTQRCSDSGAGPSMKTTPSQVAADIGQPRESRCQK